MQVHRSELATSWRANPDDSLGKDTSKQGALGSAGRRIQCLLDVLLERTWRRSRTVSVDDLAVLADQEFLCWGGVTKTTTHGNGQMQRVSQSDESTRAGCVAEYSLIAFVRQHSSLTEIPFDEGCTKQTRFLLLDGDKSRFSFCSCRSSLHNRRVSEVAIAIDAVPVPHRSHSPSTTCRQGWRRIHLRWTS